jgi:tRNA A-37 threonylcarbamoyl transferase component Bud32
MGGSCSGERNIQPLANSKLLAEQQKLKLKLLHPQKRMALRWTVDQIMPKRSAPILEILPLRENAHTLPLLVRELQSPSGVIPFVGAGFSRPMGYPLWSEFLLKQADLAGVKTAIEERIRNGQYEEAAQDLLSCRGVRRFEDAMLHNFGDERLKERELTGPVRVVPYLSTGPIITTNFDSVLEVAFARKGEPFTGIVYGRAVGPVLSALRNNDRLLIKLHGDCTDAEDRVLTLEEYEAAYGSSTPSSVDIQKPLPRLLRLVLQNRSLLFLGCSLNQDRTVRILRHVTMEYPELAHYAVVELPRHDAEVIERDRFLSDHGIRPIWYPTGKHEFVEVVLDHLVQQTNNTPSISGTVSPGPVNHAVDDAEVARALRAELSAAGCPKENIRITDVLELRVTPHSRIYRGTLLGSSVIVKLTARNVCSLDALRKLEGRAITASEGRVSIQIATPEWVGASAQNVVEIQRVYSGIPIDQMVLRSRWAVHGDLLAEIYNAIVLCLAKLHELGVVHRDVSPSNILIDGSRGVQLTLVDCSFAWDLKQPNQIPIRNANYTAPEQARGEACPESDFYSAAGICYFLANGMPPDLVNRSAFLRGLGKISFGIYYKSMFHVEPGDETAEDHSIADDVIEALLDYPSEAGVIEALLDSKVSRRPHDLWDIRLHEISRSMLSAEPLTGALDLGGNGLILMGENTYIAGPRSSLCKSVLTETPQRRALSSDLQKFLEDLKDL